MAEIKQYKCVNCGEPAAALFKTYGPTVLKLNKCDKCKEIVDKYIEYDPVIVMIDLVLMSKEAQRHVLYNTEFKSYWKLLIILIMLETYGVWRNDSLFNIAINNICGTYNSDVSNSTLTTPGHLTAARACAAWADQKGDETDLFIWEKDFYIKFISIFAGTMAFILTVQSSMRLVKTFTSQNEVSVRRLVKAFSLSHASILCTLPMLVWGAHAHEPHAHAHEPAHAHAHAAHYSLAAGYGFVVSTTVYTVLYECPTAISILVLSVSNLAKYTTSFYITPLLRTFVT